MGPVSLIEAALVAGAAASAKDITTFDRDMDDIRKIRETQAARQLDNGRNGRY